MHWLLRFIVTAAALWAIAVYVPGFHLNTWTDAIWAAIIFGIVNTLIGPILRLISLPLTFLTLGLFTIVINWALFALTVWLSPGFKTTGYPWPAWESTLVGAIIMMIVGTLVNVPLSRSEPTARV
ncbi:MAG: phage holin family protein [Candidatus Eremiobacteraeota bacterium]|nr:phage holin family protein [Candidatus Eremiobacteraeota bacterium]